MAVMTCPGVLTPRGRLQCLLEEPLVQSGHAVRAEDKAVEAKDCTPNGSLVEVLQDQLPSDVLVYYTS